MDRDQQQQLLTWLDNPQTVQTQVVSITATPLYLHVQTRTFLDRLYYRPLPGWFGRAVMFFRRSSRLGVSWSWPEMPPGTWVFEAHVPVVFGELNQPLLLEVIPRATYSRNQARAPAAGWGSASSKGDLGVSVKYGLTSTMITGRAFVEGGVQVTRWLNLGGWSIADRPSFYDPEAPFQGTRKAINLGVAFQAEREPEHNLVYNFVSFRREDTGQKVHVVNLRNTYQFSSRFLLRAIAQLDSSRRLVLGDILASYVRRGSTSASASASWSDRNDIPRPSWSWTLRTPRCTAYRAKEAGRNCLKLDESTPS